MDFDIPLNSEIHIEISHNHFLSGQLILGEPHPDILQQTIFSAHIQPHDDNIFNQDAQYHCFITRPHQNGLQAVLVRPNPEHIRDNIFSRVLLLVPNRDIGFIGQLHAE